MRAIPGSTSLGPILRDFEKKGPGVVSSFSDSLLPQCRQLLSESSSLDVLAFGEIVRSLLVLSGEEAFPLAQAGHLRSAVAHACSELEDGSPLFRSRKFPGTHKAVLQTMDDLRNWGLAAEDLEDLVKLASPRLAAKLASLAFIDRSVTEILSSLGRQQHSSQILQAFETVPDLEGDMERLLVLVGSDESPLRIQWLSWIAGYGVDVTVVLDRHACDAGVFIGAEQSVRLLGVPPRSMGSGNRLTNNLFADSDQGGPPINVSISSAADPLAESEWAIRGCLALESPDDCGIYVRDLESYAPLLESASRRLQIPLRIVRRVPLLTNSFARLVLAAWKLCMSEDVRTLIPILRSSYLDLSGQTQSMLETELRRCYAQRSDQWMVLSEFVTEHSEGIEWLQCLLEWRGRMLADTRKLSEWFRLLKEFNHDLRLPWVSLENKGSDMDERDRRALNQMERLLANHISVEEVTLSASCGARDFVDLCERLWQDGDVSIPSSDAGVRVASDPHLIGDVKHMFVLGMLEGVFPRRRSEDPILTDAERDEISNLRPEYPPLPNSWSRAQAERDEFYRVCAAAREAISFSYPLADDEKDNIPAFYLTEVERAASVDTRHDYPRRELSPPVEHCISSADLALATARVGPLERPVSVVLESEQTSTLLESPGSNSFDPRVLRDVLECPFQHLSRHVLKLKVKRPSLRWNSLRKLPQVTQLMAREDLHVAENALRMALDAELDSIYSEVPQWELQLLRSGGKRLIGDLIRREELAREIWPKTPGSCRSNVSFGSHGVRSELPGGTHIEGSIAGISTLERYKVAHLYGYRAPETSDLKPSERLFYGIHLLAMHESGWESAVEVESSMGRRTLLVMGRNGSQALRSIAAEGMKVLDLSEDDDPFQAKQKFYTAVRALVSEAVSRVREHVVDPIRGEHCSRCAYGELCRRSLTFGEGEASSSIPTSGAKPNGD